jgi:hypothetical protein
LLERTRADAVGATPRAGWPLIDSFAHCVDKFTGGLRRHARCGELSPQSHPMCQEEQEEADHAMALWEHAMSEQRAAEDELHAARHRRHAPTLQALNWKLERLRYRADLLLASAVRARLELAPDEPASMRAEERPDGMRGG